MTKTLKEFKYFMMCFTALLAASDIGLTQSVREIGKLSSHRREQTFARIIFNNRRGSRI